jgi:hypothetical protein
MKATAKRDIELQKASVERDLAEKKLISFRELSKALDIEAATSLLTEQARIDLELELTARRQEAEAEYLRKHQEAVSATQKYLDDANSQLSSALTRANAARLEAETLEAAAISINQQTTESARKKADAIIAAAEVEARSVAAQAQKDIEERYESAKSKLEKLQSERESVEVYLRNLRNVLQGASNGNENPKSTS